MAQQFPIKDYPVLVIMTPCPVQKLLEESKLCLILRQPQHTGKEKAMYETTI
jgi:hypothetical protein